MKSQVWGRVSDLVNRPPVAVWLGDPLSRVARLMWQENIGLVLVRATDGSVVGVISERDLLGVMAHQNDPARQIAADAMVTPVISVRPDDSVYDAASEMLDLGIRHMPIVDDSGTYTGVLSIRDVLRPLLVEALGG